MAVLVPVRLAGVIPAILTREAAADKIIVPHGRGTEMSHSPTAQPKVGLSVAIFERARMWVGGRRKPFTISEEVN